MLISISVVKGFQREIKNKVVNFSSHIQITDGGTNFSLESSPIQVNQPFYPEIENEEGIEHIQVFATKPGIIQSKPDTIIYGSETKINRDIEGTVFKGVGSDFIWNKLQDKIIKGKHFTVKDNKTSDSLLISNYIAKRLKLTINDKIRGFFFNGKRPIVKPFVVAGIYETGLEEFDNKFVFADIKLIQSLNGWGIESSLFLELTPENEQLVITANASGGNENYRYKFGDLPFSNFNTVRISPTHDTTIRVIITDFTLNTVTLESEPLSIPDTAWLKIEITSEDQKPIASTGEFLYESLNDSIRTYQGKNGIITTTLSTTGGSTKDYVGGFEIFIEDFNSIENQEIKVSRMSDPFLKVSKITDLENEIFGWLNLLDSNALIIIVLMIMVAVINIISLLRYLEITS